MSPPQSLRASPRALSAADKLDWLRLIRSEQVGPITFARLIERFGDAGNALSALPELARRGGRAEALRICDQATATREIEGLEKLGGRIIALGEEDYPPALAALDDAPPLISVLGRADVLKKPMIAVVGARNASANGRRFAQSLSRDLGQAGLVIASGLARGIDAAAHEGALATGTVAVVAGGVDVIYPQENAALYDRIVADGAIAAEEPLGLQPQARHFPKRNRLISGLALGVLVVEAAQRSGSLITARFALEQGREVFAVPGSPLDPRCHGTNDLIRHGATLTQSADDVMEQIRGMLRRPIAEPDRPEYVGRQAAPAPALSPQALNSAREKIVESLGPSPVQVDEIVRQCQLSPAIVAAVLLELELAGRLNRHPGHQISLAE